tara:strand:+ start:8141 stop:8443 length:303 start_codon:yes stop_codon:yes gene_type:complete
MKIKEEKTVTGVVDIICDVCEESTSGNSYPPQHGVLSANWGYGSEHDGERYEVHLCESCFFSALGSLRRARMTEFLFEEDTRQWPDGTFGLIRKNDYFND